SDLSAVRARSPTFDTCRWKISSPACRRQSEGRPCPAPSECVLAAGLAGPPRWSQKTPDFRARRVAGKKIAHWRRRNQHRGGLAWNPVWYQIQTTERGRNRAIAELR